MKQPFNKTALSYADQLEQLKSRGLHIEDEEKTLHLLKHLSYYRLSGYWHPLLQDKQKHLFKKEATFNTAFKLYCFDRELRLLVLREIEKIEVAVRARMIYVLSHSHGPFWYQEPNLFSNPSKLTTSLKSITNEYQRSDEKFIKTFQIKYSDKLPPSWMMMEITSFGTLSMLYKNLKPGRDKRQIAHYFGLNDKTFSSWLHSIVYIRNVCAHHSRLWNRVLSIQPIIPETTHNLWLLNNSISNKKVYFILSMIIYMLEIVNPKHSFRKKFDILVKNYPQVNLFAMGFPENWNDEPLWKSQKKLFYKLLKNILVLNMRIFLFLK